MQNTGVMAPPSPRFLEGMALPLPMMRDILVKTMFRMNLTMVTQLARAVCLPVNVTQELVDLGASHEHTAVRERLHEAIFEWARRHHTRISLPPETIERMSGGEPPGILIGFWDEADFEQTFGKPFNQRP